MEAKPAATPAAVPKPSAPPPSDTPSAIPREVFSGPPRVVRVPVQSTPVQSVTVFSDRAEVSRRVLLETLEPGQYEVCVDDMVASVVPDSVRVKGTGFVTILGVSFDEATVEEKDTEEPPSDGRAAAAARIAELVGLVESLEADSAYNSTQQAMVDKFTRGVLAEGAGPGAAPRNLEFVGEVMALHATRCKALVEERARLAAALKDANAELAVLRRDFAAADTPRRPHYKTVRVATVGVTVHRPSTVEFVLTYLVSNASWSAAYDFRVDGIGNSVAVTYYGVIQQLTGESWTDSRVVLSTATPQVVGTAPVLPSRRVTLRPKIVRHRVRTRMAGAVMPSMAAAGPMEEAERLEDQAVRIDEDDEDDADELPEAAVATSHVQQGVTASTYTIDRLATVDSDNKPHKVTVASIALTADFHHFIGASVSAAAYLTAWCTNTSTYTLLPSDAVNVFVDNNFVCTTSVGYVSPGERFTNFFGPDATVKVEFRSLGSNASQSGMLQRSSADTHTFVTIVKNTKTVPITVVLSDSLPISMDSTIKVKCVEPAQDVLDHNTTELGDNASSTYGAEVVAMVPPPARLSTACVGACKRSASAGTSKKTGLVWMNPTNKCVFWKYDVAPQESVNTTFQYTIERPVGTPIRISAQ